MRLLAFLIICCVGPVQAALPVMEDYGKVPPKTIYLLQDKADIIEHLNQLDALNWQPATDSDPSNSEGRERWLRFDFKVSPPATLPLVVEIDNFYSKASMLYLIHAGRIISQTPFGHDISLAERAIPIPSSVLPLAIESPGIYTVLIKTFDRFPQRIIRDISVVPERQLGFVDKPRQIALGAAFLGVFSTFMVFTLMLLVWRFRIEYAYAAVFLFAASWVIMLRENLLYPLLGLSGAWWDDNAIIAAMAATVASAVLYLQQRLRPLNQWLLHYLRISGFALLGLSLLTLIINLFGVSSITSVVYANAHIALVILALIALGRARRGNWRQRCFAVVWIGFTLLISGRILSVFFAELPLGTRPQWNIGVVLVSAWIFFEYLMEVIQTELQRHSTQTAAASRIEMINRLSHEIRTPLNAVIGLADLLQTRGDPAVTKNYAGMIRGAGQNLLYLVNDILDFSRLEEDRASMACEPFRIDCVLTEVMSSFLPQLVETRIVPKIRIAADIEYFLLGDAVRVKQIFVNLIGNAIKFSPMGSVLEINISRGDRCDGKIQLLCEVKDEGRGVPADKLKVIFEPYVQTQASDNSRLKGTGLGLAITRMLVVHMGGNIVADSEVGKGTAFRFDLWLDINPAAPDLTALFSVFTGRRVALVMSGPTFVTQLKETLTYFGANVVSFASFEDFLPARGDCRLVLTDTTSTLRESHLPLLKGALSDCMVVVLESEPVSWLQEAAPAKICSISMPLPILTIVTLAARAAIGEQVLPELLVDDDRPEPLHANDRHRVLVVDDNALNLMVCGKMLESLNISNKTVQGGREALEIVDRDTFTLVLLDCEMPDIDGYGVAKAIRKKEYDQAKPPMPIVALTAHAPEDVYERCIAAGMSEVMHKPISRQELAAVIARYAINP